MSVFAQKDFSKGLVILETNDTISGQLKSKKYFSISGVKLYKGDNKVRYSKKVVKEIYVNSDNYVKSDLGIWSHAFFIKDQSGNVNLYQYRKKKYLSGFDSDINIGRLQPALKFFCSDYPNLKDSISLIDNENINEFIDNYNSWKTQHPENHSFFEENIHTKPLINFKVSFLLPGAGFEFGLSDKFSLSTMLKSEFGYYGSYGFIINPFLDSQLRFYHNIDKRRELNKRTYKYSGNYVCIMHGMFFKQDASLMGFEYGWQRVINKRWYTNFGIGAAKWIGYDIYSFLFDLDFGYTF
jgi:hypothetical protein